MTTHSNTRRSVRPFLRRAALTVSNFYLHPAQSSALPAPSRVPPPLRRQRSPDARHSVLRTGLRHGLEEGNKKAAPERGGRAAAARPGPGPAASRCGHESRTRKLSGTAGPPAPLRPVPRDSPPRPGAPPAARGTTAPSGPRGAQQRYGSRRRREACRESEAAPGPAARPAPSPRAAPHLQRAGPRGRAGGENGRVPRSAGRMEEEEEEAAASGGAGPSCGCKGIRSCLLCEGPAQAAPPTQVAGRGRRGGAGGGRGSTRSFRTCRTPAMGAHR